MLTAQLLPSLRQLELRLLPRTAELGGLRAALGVGLVVKEALGVRVLSTCYVKEGVGHTLREGDGVLTRKAHGALPINGH